jgi:hypothetical protein
LVGFQHDFNGSLEIVDSFKEIANIQLFEHFLAAIVIPFDLLPAINRSEFVPKNVKEQLR